MDDFDPTSGSGPDPIDSGIKAGLSAGAAKAAFVAGSAIGGPVLGLVAATLVWLVTRDILKS